MAKSIFAGFSGIFATLSILMFGKGGMSEDAWHMMALAFLCAIWQLSATVQDKK